MSIAKSSVSFPEDRVLLLGDMRANQDTPADRERTDLYDRVRTET